MQVASPLNTYPITRVWSGVTVGSQGNGVLAVYNKRYAPSESRLASRLLAATILETARDNSAPEPHDEEPFLAPAPFSHHKVEFILSGQLR
jgi:hypothetical protein